MKIAGLQKLTLLDYPAHLACIVFLQGCNFKCSYCQNSELIPVSANGIMMEDEVFNFLEKRKKMLDGVVITGGEPTIYKDLPEFISKIKMLGYKVKLDTNGSNPMLIGSLISQKLIDYIAMDIKNTFDEYESIIKTKTSIDNIKKSIDLIKKSGIDHEFRTTIIKNYHDIFKITKICEYLGSKEKIFLQNFEMTNNVLNKDLVSFTKEELKNIHQIISNKFPNVEVRGL